MMETVEKTSKPDKESKVISRLKSRTEIDSYAECYPGYDPAGFLSLYT